MGTDDFRKYVAREEAKSDQAWASIVAFVERSDLTEIARRITLMDSMDAEELREWICGQCDDTMLSALRASFKAAMHEATLRIARRLQEPAPPEE